MEGRPDVGRSHLRRLTSGNEHHRSSSVLDELPSGQGGEDEQLGAEWIGHLTDPDRHVHQLI